MKILIVDDETNGREIIKSLLNLHFATSIDECRLAESVEDALNTLSVYDPDLVYLDVNMPDGTGFDFLEKAGNFRFEVIFVTAYDQYAVDAFRVHALDYLLKPIDLKAFQESFTKARVKITQSGRDASHRPVPINDRIGLTTRNGFVIIDVASIVRCEADSNYTVLVLDDGSRHLVSKTLKEATSHLERFSFFLRVHRSHLINLRKIKRYSKSEGGHVIMTDGVSIHMTADAKTHIEKMFTIF